MVNDMPFLLLAAETHNSASTSDEYMLNVWEKLDELNNMLRKEGADSLDLAKELCLLRMLSAAICTTLIDQQREMLVY